MGRRRSGRQRMRWFHSVTDSTDMNWSKLPETMKDRGVWCVAVRGVIRVRHDLGAEQQQKQQGSNGKN